MLYYFTFCFLLLLASAFSLASSNDFMHFASASLIIFCTFSSTFFLATSAAFLAAILGPHTDRGFHSNHWNDFIWRREAVWEVLHIGFGVVWVVYLAIYTY